MRTVKVDGGRRPKTEWGPLLASSSAVVRPNVDIKGSARVATIRGKQRKTTAVLGTIVSFKDFKTKVGAAPDLNKYAVLVDASFKAE